MKYLELSILILSAIITCTQEVQAFSPCEVNESVVFKCHVGNKVASLCLRRNTNQLQYRFGQESKYDFIHPKSLKNSIYKFKISTKPYPGGGENRIRFNNGIYKYFIYDITMSQQNKNSLNSIQTAGIAVYKNKERIANLTCSNSETSIAPLAFEILQREEFSQYISTD